MTGYRLGYLAGPKALVKAATRLQGQITSCALPRPPPPRPPPPRPPPPRPPPPRPPPPRPPPPRPPPPTPSAALPSLRPSATALHSPSLHPLRCRCASSIAQHAGIAALEAWPNAAPGSQLHAHVAELREKRDLALGLLRDIPALSCPTPQGAFYLLPDVSAYFGKATPEGLPIGSAEALCMALLDKYKVATPRCNPAQHTTARHGTSCVRPPFVYVCATAACPSSLPVQVALVPGEAFGAPATIRLSYAATRANIGDAVAKLAKFLRELN
jgi:aspartate/methionine/tyrosine aminotransferase